MAAAQFEGLDLSEDAPEQQTPEQPQTAPVTAPPLELDAPAADSEPPLSALDITAEDRVKSVQRRGFLKRGRFDLTPMAFVQLNDAYYPKFGPGARASYHLHESFGLGLRFLQYNLVPSDNVRLAKRQLQSRLPSVRPRMSLSLDLIWSPIYGKISIFNAIRHYDLFVVGGVGAIFSQTSETDGPHLSTHIGLGQRFAINDFLAVDVSLIEALYSDRPAGGNKAVLQNVLTVNAGLSVFWPFSFDHQEP
ncbi:MAG TPA: outer membrane beta-barrel domain-containing protein [Myxococcales bacterium]|nr:outer membrane beta-barrel domain-containing protein [Myxococcales bacterium]